jgi:flagellin
MTVIGTNISALRAQNGAKKAESMLSTAMERLSTGSRINSAKDDAAGLAISTRMTSQIRGYSVAIQNANDGISMMQTAEGAMGEVTNMMQRVRELAVQSSNGTLSDTDRASLQTETDQLMSEVNNIAKTANFNGLKLLDGSNKEIKLQTGVNTGDSVAIKMADVSTNALGLTAGGKEGQLVSGRVANISSVGAGAVQINGVNAFDTGIPAGQTKDFAKTLAAAINSNSAKTGVTATASNSVTSAKITKTEFASGDLSINGVAIAGAGSVDELVSNINKSDAGVTAVLNKDQTITLSNSDGSTITTDGVLADNGFPDASTSYQGYVSLQSTDGKNIKIAAADADASGTVEDTEVATAQKLGFNVSTDGVSFSGQDVTAAALTDGELQINGVKIGASTDDTAVEKAAAINAKSDLSGVKATVNGDKLVLNSLSGGEVRVEGAGAAKIGFVGQGGSDKMTSKLDISTQEAASASIKTIDKALDKLTSSRGDLGAVQNRLQTAVNNLTTTTTNLSDARSRITDADFSVETTNLAKSQILSQAATAMLAQANQSSQNVMSLLR